VIDLVAVGVTMPDPAARRGLTMLLALGLGLADPPTARAQEPTQLAVGRPRRPPRPPLDPAARELRQTRGMLAGGIVLTALCGAGFGLFTAAVASDSVRWYGASGDRALAFGGVMLGCTLMSIAAIGVSGRRLHTLKRGGRVAWSGGLGLRF
jgi:hypothetical protein